MDPPKGSSPHPCEMYTPAPASRVCAGVFGHMCVSMCEETCVDVRTRVQA